MSSLLNSEHDDQPESMGQRVLSYNQSDLLRQRQGGSTVVGDLADDFSYKIDNPIVVSKSLANILFKEEFSDVVLICGASVERASEQAQKTKRIFAHRQILAASSEVF